MEPTRKGKAGEIKPGKKEHSTRLVRGGDESVRRLKRLRGQLLSF